MASLMPLVFAKVKNTTEKNRSMRRSFREGSRRPHSRGALLMVMKGLPLAYSKDMQEDKEQVFDAADTLMLALAAMTGMVGDMTANRAVLAQAAATGFSTATDLADWLVRTLNLPFREAHHITGALVAMADSAGKLQLAVADMFYQADSERTAAFRDAALARYEGNTLATQLRNQASVTRYEAGFSLLDAAVETYNQKALDFQSSLVNMGYQSDLNTASMTASATRSQADAARLSSYGSLLGNASQAAFSAYKMS
jgi:hypothetical protein